MESTKECIKCGCPVDIETWNVNAGLCEQCAIAECEQETAAMYKA